MEFPVFARASLTASDMAAAVKLPMATSVTPSTPIDWKLSASIAASAALTAALRAASST